MDNMRSPKVSVIMYHNFVTEADVKSGVEFDEYSVNPQDFEQDLIWLRDNGYTTITSDDLLRHLEGKKSLPHKAVIISIDDGSWGVYTNAYPLLKKYNIINNLYIFNEMLANLYLFSYTLLVHRRVVTYLERK